MSNPFAILCPALEVLATEGRVSPATGQAIEDQVTPDIEEIYDRATGGNAEVRSIWETRRKLYHPLRPVLRTERHLFRYFPDGSVRTYFIGTVIEHQRSSPVQLAQVRAAVIHRQDDGGLHIVHIKRKLILLLRKDDDFFREFDPIFFEEHFVDELNKYAPARGEAAKSPILEQVLDISERGRSFGIVLTFLRPAVPERCAPARNRQRRH